MTDATRWKRVKFTNQDKLYFGWRNMNDSTSDYYSVVLDDATQTMTMTRMDKEVKKETEDVYVLKYVRLDADRFKLEGTIGADAVAVELKRLDTSKMLLVSRGFHWINEMPFNR